MTAPRDGGERLWSEERLDRGLAVWVASIPPAPPGSARRAVEEAVGEGLVTRRSWWRLRVTMAPLLGAVAMVAVLAASLLLFASTFGWAGKRAPTLSATPMAAGDLAPAAPAAVTACLSRALVTLTPPSVADLQTVMITRAEAERAALAAPGLTTASGAAVTWRTVGPTYLGWFSSKPGIDVPATAPALAYLVPVLGTPITGLPLDRALVPVQSASGMVEGSINVDWDPTCRDLLFGSPEASPPPSQPVPTLAAPGTPIALPPPVGSDLFQLTFEPQADVLWAISTDATMDTARLVRFDPATRTFRSWALPPPEAHGDGGPEIRIVPDGARGVWLADAHRISYFDLGSQTLMSRVLPTRMTSAQNLPVTGNWNTGATTRNGELLLARWGVPWLSRFDRNLDEIGRVALPASYAGAAVDLASTADGTLVVASEVFGTQSSGTLETISPSGQVHDGHLLGFTLRAVGTEVMSTGSSDGTQLIHADGSVTQLTVGRDAPTLAAVDPRGGLTLAVAGPDIFGLVRVVGDTVASRLDLPTACISLVGGLGGPQSPSATSCTRVLAGNLTDVATDATGMTWYLLDHHLFSVSL